MNEKKILKSILNGTKNIKFNDFIKLISAFGFQLDRINVLKRNHATKVFFAD